MTPRIPNFRGHQAVVLHPADANRELLVEQLSRLGVDSEVIWPPREAMSDKIDVVFFDADRRPTAMGDRAWVVQSPPLIAISGTEAPGRLEAMLALRPGAVLNKPLRRETIFKALVFAYHNQRHWQKTENERAFLGEQIKARALVFKSILLVMRRFNVDDDEAFAAVRRASMSNNLLVEAFAFLFMSDPGRYMRLVEREIGKSRSETSRAAEARSDGTMR